MKGKGGTPLDKNFLIEASFCKEVFKQENGCTVYYTALADLVQCYVYFLKKGYRSEKIRSLSEPHTHHFLELKSNNIS